MIIGNMIAVQFRLGGGIPQGRNPEGEYGPSAFIAIAGFMAIASTIIRWLVIPRKADYKQLLILMIIGIALANTISYFGIFLIRPIYPQTKAVLFYTCLLYTSPSPRDGLLSRMPSSA